MHNDWQPGVIDLSLEELEENEALSAVFDDEEARRQFEEVCSIT